MENTGLFKGGGEELSEYLKSPAQTVYFLFVETEVDKRSKLYKTVSAKGCAVEFGIQDENTLKRWVLGMVKRENKKISEPALNFLLEMTGTDMENIQKEMEKLLLLHGPGCYNGTGYCADLHQKDFQPHF